jgi:hypothetical protein
MYFDVVEYDATSGFDSLRVDHMLDERGLRGASRFARHRDGFVFHSDSGGEDSDVAGLSCVGIPRLGRRQRNVDDDESF